MTTRNIMATYNWHEKMSWPCMCTAATWALCISSNTVMWRQSDAHAFSTPYFEMLGSDRASYSENFDVGRKDAFTSLTTPWKCSSKIQKISFEAVPNDLRVHRCTTLFSKLL